MEALTLSQLNHLIALVFRDEFSNAYWITAEISEGHTAGSGHYYMELIETDAQKRTVAKARAMMWATTYFDLLPKFEDATGQRLAAGMKVMLLVTPQFHELYGYSLTVQDIDPTYTLGDQAQRRREILAQLEEDGVLGLQQELTLPSPLRRIAIVSSATAAGYGDFCAQLEKSGYAFTTRLFPAMMQGEKTESSLIAALESIYEESEAWDVVVIIRGGGATSDLNSFDSYLLAATVAQFPLPILTGIGHERDETVLDYVAHAHFKTPTAVAAFLIDDMRTNEQRIEELESRLLHAVRQRMAGEWQRYDLLSRRFQYTATLYVARERERLLRHAASLRQNAAALLRQEASHLDTLPQRLERSLALRIEREKEKIRFAEKATALAGPERILRMGYSLTMCGDRILTHSSDVRPGDRLTTRMADGTFTSIAE